MTATLVLRAVILPLLLPLLLVSQTTVVTTTVDADRNTCQGDDGHDVSSCQNTAHEVNNDDDYDGDVTGVRTDLNANAEDNSREADREDDYDVDNDTDTDDANINTATDDANTVSNAAEAGDDTPLCLDSDERCAGWANTGECDANPRYMLPNCEKSCGICNGERGDKIECIDEHEKCNEWAEVGECEVNPGYMLKGCRRSCASCPADAFHDTGVTQTYKGTKEGHDEHAVLKAIRLSNQYFRLDVLPNRTLAPVLSLCKNKHRFCTYWATLNECNKDKKKYMSESCSLACHSCYYPLPEVRCPLDPDAKKALLPGELDKIFESLTNDESYDVTAYSRPTRLPEDYEKKEDELEYKIGPWIVTFDNFLTDDECDHLVEMGRKSGYKRSVNTGAMKDGKYESKIEDTRTSENAWCNTPTCYNDTKVSAVVFRMANVTSIPQENQEYLQLLRYTEGQYYKRHHDYIIHNRKKQYGPRVLTFFLYLNDVEKGGGTYFNDMNITVTPKKGSAVLWPSVLDADPFEKDDRTRHEALAVEEGIKYGANAWIHLHDFKGPYKIGCS